MKSSLIIPTYHATPALVETTKSCLESLRYGRPEEVIVIDDASPIKADLDFKLYTLRINRASNGGYAKAVNTGLSHATYDTIIIANNDIVFTPDWLEAILKPLEEGYDISTIRTSDSSGYETAERITEGNKFGSIWAMKRAVYEKLGGLDESFGNYFEDLDYRRRALNAGFKIAKNHAGLVEHEGKATFNEVDPEDKYFWEARDKYLEKWGVVGDDFEEVIGEWN